MRHTNQLFKIAAIVALSFLVYNCTSSLPASPFVSAEPEAGSIQTRTPRTLRLYFEQLPDVERSTVILDGPTGNLNLRGLHTMGANDLMMEIFDEVVDGDYTVHWSTFVGDDPAPYQGQYTFSVESN